MKKIAALFIAVVMVLISTFVTVPMLAVEATVEVSSADALQEAMNGNKTIKLTQDIDLSAGWIRIEAFDGTVDGNGHIITVPSDMTIINRLYGTVKDLKLTGTMELNEGDLVTGFDQSGQPSAGVLANYGIGATVHNVVSDVRVKLRLTNNSVNDYNFGAVIGTAMSDWNDDGNELTDTTVISDCATFGSVTIGDIDTTGQGYSYVGGIVANAFSKTEIINCASDIDFMTTNRYCTFGGILGRACVDGIVVEIDSSLNLAQDDFEPIIVKNCIFSGTYTESHRQISTAGGIVGECSAKGLLEITSCLFTGTLLADNGAGYGIGHIIGRVRNKTYGEVLISGCASVGSCKNSGAEQSLLVANCRISGAAKASGNIVLNGQSFPSGVTVSSASVTKDTVSEVTAAFYANNPDVCAVHGYLGHDFQVNENNVLSTGICKICGAESGEAYAGFIQFAGDVANCDRRIRIIMVITEEEMNNASYDEFTMLVTINGKTVTFSDSQFTSYTKVSADGTEYVAADGYAIFGMILNLNETDVDSFSLKIFSGNDVDAGEKLYSASYSK